MSAQSRSRPTPATDDHARCNECDRTLRARLVDLLRGAFDNIAHSVIDRRCGVPDVYRAASAMGVHTIELAAMVETGRLDFGNSGPVVRVNARSSPKAARFTVMHELGHLLMCQDTAMARYADMLMTVELACDEFAGASLVPDDALDAFDTAELTLGLLRSVAAGHDVEVSVVADRVSHWYGRTFWLLQMQRHRSGEHWIPVSVSGARWPFPSLPTVDAGSIGYLDRREEEALVRLAWQSNELVSTMRVHCQGDVAWALAMPQQPWTAQLSPVPPPTNGDGHSDVRKSPRAGVCAHRDSSSHV